MPYITQRERQIMTMLTFGFTNRGIGHVLGTKETTVRNQLHIIYQKLGVNSRTEAAIWWDRQCKK